MAALDSISAPNSSSVPKPHVYDLLNRLNAAFARVHRNMEALEQVGIFDPLMMQVLNRQSEQLRAGANYHLLGAMRRIEERDRQRFAQPPNEEIPTPKQVTRRKAGLLVLRANCIFSQCLLTSSGSAPSAYRFPTPQKTFSGSTICSSALPEKCFASQTLNPP
jgi:hypothetical protein